MQVKSLPINERISTLIAEYRGDNGDKPNTILIGKAEFIEFMKWHSSELDNGRDMTDGSGKPPGAFDGLKFRRLDQFNCLEIAFRYY